MIQVRVLGIALDAAEQHIILLKPLLEEPGSGLVLPIWIGSQEATSILLAVAGEEPPRPMTHDLMTTIVGTLRAGVERVEVTRIDDGTFYAEISLSTPWGPRVLDARPSDAVALAVRVEAPIFVADEVLGEAGMPAEVVESSSGDDDEPESDDEKVDEFKRFLEDVDPEDFQG